jgi:rhamnogalacturonyl hydrolase YesR
MKELLVSLLCIISLVSCTSRIEPKVNVDLERAQQTLDSLYHNYSVENSNLFRENYPYDGSCDSSGLTSSDDQQEQVYSFSHLWPYSGVFSAISSLYETTRDTKYKKMLDQIIIPGVEEYFDCKRTPYAYSSYLCNISRSDRFYDDNIWLGIDFVDAYRLTEEEKYLQKAEMIWKFIESGMDKQLDGGIYWCEQTKSTKNTCSNAPASVLALKLYIVTKKQSYLNQAISLYGWTKGHLRDKMDNLYYDNIQLNGKIDKTKYAYNSGQMMQAAAMIYKLTKNKMYLKDAQEIAQECYNYFFVDYTPENGRPFKMIKNGDIWFTAVMLRGYFELYDITKDKFYLEAFNKSLDHAWNYARDEKGMFDTDLTGENKDGKKLLLSQAAMVEMYSRLAAIK